MTLARLLLAAAIVLPRLALACEPAPAGSPLDGLCAEVAAPCIRTPRIAVLSAFPGEQRTLRAAATVTERIEIGGRTMLVGQLAGQEVVLSLTGIGLINATNTTTAILDHLDVSAIVFSGVAGGDRIADVVVPATWTDVASGKSFAVDPGLLGDAAAVAASDVMLDKCTDVPSSGHVCVLHDPRVVVGGVGQSSDAIPGKPVPCTPGAGEILGCEARTLATVAAADATMVAAVDEESAAVAAVAVPRGIPFVVLRGVSDGINDAVDDGDPLGQVGFQFFEYYKLAADNAAAVLIRLLGMLPVPDTTQTRAAGSGSAAACGFERAASADCGGATASRKVAKLVSRGCALRAQASRDSARAKRLDRRAAKELRNAAAAVKRGALTSCCATTLRTRLRAAAAATVAAK